MWFSKDNIIFLKTNPCSQIEFRRCAWFWLTAPEERGISYSSFFKHSGETMGLRSILRFLSAKPASQPTPVFPDIVIDSSQAEKANQIQSPQETLNTTEHTALLLSVAAEIAGYTPTPQTASQHTPVMRHMTVRFARDTDWVSDYFGPPSCACHWCGFKIRGKKFSYRDKNKKVYITCKPCFDAQHALSVTPEKGVFVWCPEIPQNHIPHIVRAISVAEKRISDEIDTQIKKIEEFDKIGQQHVLSKYKANETLDQNSINMTEDEIFDVANSRIRHQGLLNVAKGHLQSIKRFRTELQSGASDFDTFLKNAMGGSLLDIWADLSEEHQAALLDGLRYVPVEDESDFELWLSRGGQFADITYDDIVHSDWLSACRVHLSQPKHEASSNSAGDAK